MAEIQSKGEQAEKEKIKKAILEYPTDEKTKVKILLTLLDDNSIQNAREIQSQIKFSEFKPKSLFGLGSDDITLEEDEQKSELSESSSLNPELLDSTESSRLDVLTEKIGTIEEKYNLTDAKSITEVKKARKNAVLELFREKINGSITQEDAAEILQILEFDSKDFYLYSKYKVDTTKSKLDNWGKTGEFEYNG